MDGEEGSSSRLSQCLGCVQRQGLCVIDIHISLAITINWGETMVGRVAAMAISSDR